MYEGRQLSFANLQDREEAIKRNHWDCSKIHCTMEKNDWLRLESSNEVVNKGPRDLLKSLEIIAHIWRLTSAARQLFVGLLLHLCWVARLPSCVDKQVRFCWLVIQGGLCREEVSWLAHESPWVVMWASKIFHFCSIEFFMTDGRKLEANLMVSSFIFDHFAREKI